MLAEQDGNCIRAESDPWLAQQAGPERAHHRRQRRIVPLYPYGETVDLTSRRVGLAQQIEGGPALRIVALETAAEVRVVATRVVDRPAQRCQHLGRLCRCGEGEPGKRRARHQLRQLDDRLKAASGAVGRMDLRRATQFAVQAVASDVWRGDATQISQFDVHLWLAFLDIQHRLEIRALQ